MLKLLDDVMQKDCFYARYMNEWVMIFVTTCRQLRRAVKRMHGVISMLQFKLAREKTYIGRIKRRFEYLGYRFTHHGLIGLVRKAIVNFIERLSRLYESDATTIRIMQYVQHW